MQKKFINSFFFSADSAISAVILLFAHFGPLGRRNFPAPLRTKRKSVCGFLFCRFTAPSQVPVRNQHLRPFANDKGHTANRNTTGKSDTPNNLPFFSLGIFPGCKKDHPLEPRNATLEDRQTAWDGSSFASFMWRSSRGFRG
jgi:hypothetical protein